MELTPWTGKFWQGALPCTDCQERVMNFAPLRPVVPRGRSGRRSHGSRPRELRGAQWVLPTRNPIRRKLAPSVRTGGSSVQQASCFFGRLSSENDDSCACSPSTQGGKPFVGKSFRAKWVVSRDHDGNRAMSLSVDTTVRQG